MIAAEGMGLMGGNVLPLLAIAAMLLVSYLLMRRARLRTLPRVGEGRERLDEWKASRAARETLDTVLVQLEEVAREVNAQLDTKFVRLETLIEDADERIDRLETLEREISAVKKRITQRRRSAKPVSTTPTVRSERRPALPFPLPDEVSPDLPRADKPDAEPPAASTAVPGDELDIVEITLDAPPTPALTNSESPLPPPAEPISDPQAPDPRYAHIYQLADAGQRAIQIAEAVNMPLGEVELILSLRNYR